MNVVVNATVTTDQEENLNVKAQLKVNIFYLNNSIIFVLRCSKVLGLFCICRYCALLWLCIIFKPWKWFIMSCVNPSCHLKVAACLSLYDPKSCHVECCENFTVKLDYVSEYHPVMQTI